MIWLGLETQFSLCDLTTLRPESCPLCVRRFVHFVSNEIHSLWQNQARLAENCRDYIIYTATAKFHLQAF